MSNAKKSESDLSELLVCKTCGEKPALSRPRGDYMYSCCENMTRSSISPWAFKLWNSLNAK